MIKKVDLVMWTKNGAGTLGQVLKRINEIIPENAVNNRIIIDDHSTDNTREIAESFGWQVIFNKGKGISDGANTALEHVTSDYFVSFEQDIFLARDWWIKIPALLEDCKVVVASGVRIPNNPPALKKLQEYVTEKYRIKSQRDPTHFYGKTLDNTIYQTEIIRQIGGFPKLRVNGGVDNVLVKRLYEHGYIWAVNYDVRSIHLRKGLMDELKHYYWYGSCQKELAKQLYEKNVDLIQATLITMFSPIRGLQVAYIQRCWQIAYVYPALRLSAFFGILRGHI